MTPAVAGDGRPRRPDPSGERLRDLLDAIPDLERDEPDTTPRSAPEGGPDRRPGRVGAAASTTRPSTIPPRPLERAPASPRPPSPPQRTGDPPPGERPPADADGGGPPWWRRAGFAAAIVLLVLAIPLLGREGYRLIVNSTDGQEVSRLRDPMAPNYEEVVDSTPTMVLVETATDGSLDSLTFVSLNSDRGGTVLFLPNTTVLTEPEPGRETLDEAYESEMPVIDRAQQEVAREVGRRLNVGIDEVVAVDDRSLAQLVDPVGSVPIDNPDQLTLDDGTRFPTGPISLTPEQVGPYLGKMRQGEDQLSQFARHELVWRSWLNAIAASGDDGIVPGPADEGLGPFLHTLASGSVNYAVVPGDFTMVGGYVVDQEALGPMMVDAVPVPDPPEPGARLTVRLLNGAEPGGPPNEIIRKVVASNGAVTTIGNGPSFDNQTTEIVYALEEHEDAATLMLAVLGAAQGTTRLDPSAPDNIDLTIVLGRDALEGGS